MGYCLPAAVAAKVASPERVVVCFAGDGDFQTNCQELGTVMQAGAQPTVLILNNGIYGTIRAHQERNYPGACRARRCRTPTSRCLPVPTAITLRVETTVDFAAAFERALNSKTGTLLDLNISPEALTPRQTLSQMRAAALAQLIALSQVRLNVVSRLS